MMIHAYFFRVLIKYWYFPSHRPLAYKYILSMSGCFSIKFTNTFVFPDPDPLLLIFCMDNLEYMVH